jgi:hypothetical protein
MADHSCDPHGGRAPIMGTCQPHPEAGDLPAAMQVVEQLEPGPVGLLARTVCRVVSVRLSIVTGPVPEET